MTVRKGFGLALLAAAVVFALAPLYRSGDASIPVHHLFHSIMLLGAAVAGLMLTTPQGNSEGHNVGLLVLAFVFPVIAMFLMWPSEYAIFERSPVLHAGEHLGLVLLGFLTAFAGRRYTAGVGVAATVSLLIMSFLAIGGYGTSPPPSVH